MTRVTRDFADTMQKEAVPAVSADVIFASSRFPNYKIGANNQIMEAKDDPKVLSMKEVVARETAQLLEQQKRLSVRDLASKFEKGLAAAAKLSEEARLREAASLEKHVLLKKLRDALESLKGRVAGRNKDDIEEAIAMVEALAVQLTQREGELMQEKSEVKKLANFLKQASEDARKLVDEERAFARAEIESARAAVQRVEEALQEHERMSRASGKQDLEELMKEVQEARRIKMLHQPSKVMDMEHELRALRTQLMEKAKQSIRLKRELAMSKRGMDNSSQLYELDGHEALGSYLQIQPSSDNAPDLSKCLIQWYRVSSEGDKKELISGATRPVYALEPFDVGRILQVDITTEGQMITLTTTGPIDPAAGLGSYVEALVRKHDVEFNVVITQMNDANYSSESIHVFHVGKMRIKLCKAKTTIAKEYYSASMQLCGVRGGGNAAPQALYWQAKKGLSFVLAFESQRERNAAIMLARRFAFDCNIILAGPDDRASLGT
ncbi:stomatal closure-related actin-binding protein 1 [Ziziphus jujuba]|uniref:Stomatal closure-related actin-binding protein 1 n=3 Tax=Ziziphus jujuba TaxID=326968 RepID=A0A6P3Z872_ZIZJJ|nr:stomatal closure-related actin-binding protein 1 [Ziziphus jujuba]XP_015873239.3 stomatal closure-related actin-binding protein 1 [Ziziphus jujuba]XP_060668325.1 stomatal closure-related actin-binding protein 1 [Ziziphus jujuba]